jgi:sugar phosphate permease
VKPPSSVRASATSSLWPFKGHFYGWAIAAATLVATFASAPMFGPVLGVFVRPIGDDLGWSRTTISLAFTLGSVAGTLFSAAIGTYLDRRGARGVVVVAGMVIAGCLLGMAVMTQPWHFWAFFGLGRAVATAGVQFGTTVALANWFIRRRGRAMAIGGSGLRFGQAVLPLLIHAIIVAYSWRHAFGALAGLALVLVAGPAALFIRRRPEDFGLHPDGAAPAAPGASGRPVQGLSREREVSWTLQEARRTRVLWLLILVESATFFVNGSVNLHAAANLQDRGLSAGEAASVTSIFAATSALTTFVFGFLLEGLHVRYGAMIAISLYLTALIVIIFAHTFPVAVLFGVLFGAANGGWTTVERLLFPDYFGRRSVGAIRGFAAPIRGALSPLGAVMAGYVRDVTGSYTIAFIVFGGLCVVAFVAMLLAVPPRKPAAA